MPTDIQIASNALLLLGDGPISSFTETGNGAQVMNAIYTRQRNSALSKHPWKFALKEQDLSKLSQAPDTKTGFANQFQLPTDMLRLWEIQPRNNYEIVGNVVYSNETELRAVYTFAAAESTFPDDFTEALEYLLASKAAMPITEDETKQANYKREAKELFVIASGHDSGSAPQISITSSPFIEARLGSR